MFRKRTTLNVVQKLSSRCRLLYSNPNVHMNGIIVHSQENTKYQRPAIIRVESKSAAPFVWPTPAPTKPATVLCMSVHSDSLGTPMSPMSYMYSLPSLPPSAARRPSLRSHAILLIARPVPTGVDTTGTYEIWAQKPNTKERDQSIPLCRCSNSTDQIYRNHQPSRT